MVVIAALQDLVVAIVTMIATTDAIAADFLLLEVMVDIVLLNKILTAPPHPTIPLATMVLSIPTVPILFNTKVATWEE